MFLSYQLNNANISDIYKLILKWKCMKFSDILLKCKKIVQYFYFLINVIQLATHDNLSLMLESQKCKIRKHFLIFFLRLQEKGKLRSIFWYLNRICKLANCSLVATFSSSLNPKNGKFYNIFFFFFCLNKKMVNSVRYFGI